MRLPPRCTFIFRGGLKRFRESVRGFDFFFAPLCIILYTSLRPSEASIISPQHASHLHTNTSQTDSYNHMVLTWSDGAAATL